MKALEEEQTKLLQLYYEGGVSRRVMQRETERIEAEEQTLYQRGRAMRLGWRHRCVTFFRAVPAGERR